MGGKEIYVIKPGQNGEENYKARFLAKAYSQVLGVRRSLQHFFSTFSYNLSWHANVQMAMAIHQIDIETAYLNASIECELYIEEPKAMREKAPASEEKFGCKLRKSLDGPKKSSCTWNML